MHPTASLQAFVINLDRDRGRREAMIRQFAGLDGIALNFIEAVWGRALPDHVCQALVKEDGWTARKGTIGCFLSHVAAWEAVARSTASHAVILEDDVEVASLDQIRRLSLPDDLGILFLNDRMATGDGVALEVVELTHSLRRLDRLQSGPGGDGYLLTPDAARAMLAACACDLYYGHVDGRILRYATTEQDLARIGHESWIGHVISRHHHPVLTPSLGIVKGYSLSRPLVRHGGLQSSRERADAVAGGAAVRAQHGTASATPSSAGLIPLRYWNRIRNVGDAINPYINKAVTGRDSYFCTDPDAAHVLGIGSIVAMASAGSHIWGSGILDPAAPLDESRFARICALRGTLTRDLLWRAGHVRADMPLGDPGMLVASMEMPPIAAGAIRHIAVIPHHALISNPYFDHFASSRFCKILDPRIPPADFIRELRTAELVISQSLHGLVFAESLGIPYVWLSHSDDERWQFKFRDWFTNLLSDPPSFPFGTPIEELLNEARLYGIRSEPTAIARAFPELCDGGARFEKHFSSPEKYRPPIARIVLAADASETASGEEIRLERLDEHELAEQLNRQGLRFADPPPFFLQFGQHPGALIDPATAERLVDLLDMMPDTHFIGISPIDRLPAERLSASIETAHGLRLLEWQPADAWSVPLLIRHPYEFSFDAPALMVAHGSVPTGDAAFVDHLDRRPEAAAPRYLPLVQRS